MSTVNACCAVCATLRIPSAKPSTPRAQEGKAHNRRAPQNFPLQLGLRSHLAVARLLPVHWLRPLTTPATTPAKVHAGLNRDFLKKTPCAPHSRSPSPAVFFSRSCPSTTTEKPGKRHCRPNSPSRKRLSHWIGLVRPTALPLILPVGPYWSLPSTKSPARTSWISIARPRNLDTAARLPVVARISPLPRRNKLDKTPRHPSRLSGFEKTNDLQK